MDVVEATPEMGDGNSDAAQTGGDDDTREVDGILKIYARRDDTQIKLIADDIPVPEADRLLDIAFFRCPEDAAAVSTWCADILSQSRMGAATDGWHNCRAAYLPTLLNAARNNLHVTFGAARAPETRAEAEADPVPEVQCASQNQAVAVSEPFWCRDTEVQLGCLVGQGLTAKQIADVIGATPGNVQRQANRIGLRLRDAPRGQVACQLPLPTMVTIARAADAVNQTPAEFVRRWLIRAAADPARYGMVVISA